MHKTIVFKIFFIIISLFIISCTYVQAEEATLISHNDEDFKQANEYYEQGHYFKSIELYKNIIKSGIQNGYIYFNLGNAYFKNEQIGHAVLNYKRAELFQPRNPDIKANLKFALEHTEDQLSTEESVKPVLHIIFFWFFDFNLPEIIIFTIISNFVLCFLVILYMYKSNEVIKNIIIVLLIVTLILISTVCLKVYTLNNPTEGVITTKIVDIKSGNGYNFATLYKLHEGTVLELVENKKDWYKFILSDGKKGWINSKNIGLVKTKAL